MSSELDDTLKVCVICASNQNRSMEAHHTLQKAGFHVESYGTGSSVRLPGPSVDKPNVYSFGTPYDRIYNELKNQDMKLYKNNGLLPMLDRNRNIKLAPQRWQDSKKCYNLIITCEERCFEAVLEDLLSRNEEYNHPTHVINVEIRDSPEDAAVAGKAILVLVERIRDSINKDLWPAKINEVLDQWQNEYPNLPILHSSNFF